MHQDTGQGSRVVSPTRRQLEMLQMAARGASNREIAASLEISEQAVKNQFTDILIRLNAYNRAHAVAVAMRRGMIT